MKNSTYQILRNMIPALSPYVCVVVVQFLLLYPLHATMDLSAWDETGYMVAGEQFSHGSSLGPVSLSPIYILLYSQFVKMFGTVGSVFLMQYFVKIGVSTPVFSFSGKAPSIAFAAHKC